MPSADPPARMPQIAPEDFSDEAKEMFARWTQGPFKDADKNPVLKTFVHHPKLADLFSQLNIHLLLTSTLPVRQRQIAIMRTAWICKARYMWSSHLRTSLGFGLEPELFGPLQAGADDPYFTDFERTIIRATEELVNDRRIGDANWAALSAEWNEQQLLDFMFTVGAYVLVAGVMRSTGVEREPELIELAAKYGAPE
jgi:4-carboxymuconolactone decarboxylase